MLTHRKSDQLIDSLLYSIKWWCQIDDKNSDIVSNLFIPFRLLARARQRTPAIIMSFAASNADATMKSQWYSITSFPKLVNRVDSTMHDAEKANRANVKIAHSEVIVIDR